MGEAILFLILTILSEIVSFFHRVIKLPIRFTTCIKNGHDWRWLGNGFFGMFAPKYPLQCKKCAKLGKWEDTD